jgi:hypothetical protein
MVLKRENETLKQSCAALDELVNTMRYMPEDVARLVFKRLRTTSDPSMVLQSFRSERIATQPSEQATARAGLPLIHSKVELELTARHPFAYPILDPAEEELLLKVPMLLKVLPTHEPNSPHKALDSAHASLASSSSNNGESVTSTLKNTSVVEPIDSHASAGFIRPEPPVSYFDRRLEKLEMRFWTTVNVSNDYAARAMSQFFRIDHPVTGVFDANLFIDDLVNKRFDYCSSFLVSSLLAYASVSEQ